MALDPSLLAKVGFGTAALGSNTFEVVTMALDAGFRTFDTAEADWWYDQRTVGSALQAFFDDLNKSCGAPDVSLCAEENLKVDTKIPPWELVSEENIRSHARDSREELLSFCDTDVDGPYPLDVYYIHAPQCWKGWHSRCQTGHETKLSIRESWVAMEKVVALDGSARRIGLSNVRPDELLDIIDFVKSRKTADTTARMPDVLQAYADPLSSNSRLREICALHGIEFVSYSTLGTQHRMRGGGNPVLTHEVLGEIATRYERSIAEVVLSWAVQNDMRVIPRSGRKDHIQELGRLLRDGTAVGFLGEEDVATINKLDR
uniref:NADP-dependent oxidoreductase domain-containing protein n=1 Tax=Corethron hystrix TaxID=216773 RepID=A0A7S1BKU7_9STRA|mmetsp:Transcript_2967/g.5556  ORF Transcript_2967/g.5556 Transcript_2967/m.5556 type:complete len:317 (+) Transcript_2967:66-1016(+)